MLPPPFQKGIPTENLTTLLLTSQLVNPDTLRVLIEESEGMLTSQKVRSYKYKIDICRIFTIEVMKYINLRL